MMYFFRSFYRVLLVVRKGEIFWKEEIKDYICSQPPLVAFGYRSLLHILALEGTKKIAWYYTLVHYNEGAEMARVVLQMKFKLKVLVRQAEPGFPGLPQARRRPQFLSVYSGQDFGPNFKSTHFYPHRLSEKIRHFT